MLKISIDGQLLTEHQLDSISHLIEKVLSGMMKKKQFEVQAMKALSDYKCPLFEFNSSLLPEHSRDMFESSAGLFALFCDCVSSMIDGNEIIVGGAPMVIMNKTGMVVNGVFTKFQTDVDRNSYLLLLLYDVEQNVQLYLSTEGIPNLDSRNVLPCKELFNKHTVLQNRVQELENMLDAFEYNSSGGLRIYPAESDVQKVLNKKWNIAFDGE